MAVDADPSVRRTDRPRSARSRAGTVLLAVAVPLASLALGACSDKPTDPAEARLQRVESRLRSSFSARQARCILEQLDTPVIRALDQRRDLTADSPALRQYTAALQVCVNGDGATTTTTAGASSTTAPTTTTTAGG